MCKIYDAARAHKSHRVLFAGKHAWLVSNFFSFPLNAHLDSAYRLLVPITRKANMWHKIRTLHHRGLHRITSPILLSSTHFLCTLDFKASPPKFPNSKYPCFINGTSDCEMPIPEHTSRTYQVPPRFFLRTESPPSKKVLRYQYPDNKAHVQRNERDA